MCANYVPVSRRDRLLSFFGVERGPDRQPTDTWPLNVAPFIRLVHADPPPDHPHAHHRHERIAEDGLFGLLPPFATEIGYGRRTYNARSETVDRLPSFREAWANGQRCIIPAEAIYEPCWETGKSERWVIHQEGHVPFGVAGIWSVWYDPKSARNVLSFAMLTVNADRHPFMKHFHRPEDEKRMVVILKPADYAEWLSCKPEAAKKFFRMWEGPLLGEPAALPPKAPPASSVRTVRPPKPEDDSDRVGKGETGWLF